MKDSCVSMVNRAREYAENIGLFREMVIKTEERLKEDNEKGVPYGAEPLRIDRERMLSDKKEELAYEERRFLSLIEEIVRCECNAW